MIEKLKRLVESEVEGVNTVALGIITQVDLQKMRCNVKLKHKIQGNEIELFDVPIAFQKFDESAIIVAPKEGDNVLVVFSKYELEEQLKDESVVDVNELYLYDINNAIVIGGLYTAVDQIPAINEDEILIWHKSGAYIKFKQDGSLEIKASRIDFLKL